MLITNVSPSIGKGRQAISRIVEGWGYAVYTTLGRPPFQGNSPYTRSYIIFWAILKYSK